MRCSRCKDAKGHKAYDGLCGICSMIVARDAGEPFTSGVQGDKLVPAHFNVGIGEQIDDFGHLKRRMKVHQNEGTVGEWG